MAEEDEAYREKYDHSTVSRWERGITLPTHQHLLAFGSALKLHQSEVDGLIRLAALDEETGSAPTVIRSTMEEGGTFSVSSASESNTSSSKQACAEFRPFDRRGALRSVASPLLVPGSCIAVAGYILAAYGWNDPLALGLYIALSIGMVTGQSFLRMRRSHGLHELFFITVFFQLSVPLLHGPLTYMDTYGLYAVGNFGGTVIPFMLCLAINLIVALVSALMFDSLWTWRYSRRMRDSSALHRAAWIVLPPTGFVYAFLLAFAYIGLWILGLCVLIITAGVFLTLIVLRDEADGIDAWERKFLLVVSAGMTIILGALGVFAALVTFLEPSLISSSGDTLLNSWENDLDTLGYSADELMERYRHAILLSWMVALAYMIIVVGGKLIVTVYRLDGGNSSRPTGSGESAPLTVSERRVGVRHGRLDLRYWLWSLGRYKGSRIVCVVGDALSLLARERSNVDTGR